MMHAAKNNAGRAWLLWSRRPARVGARTATALIATLMVSIGGSANSATGQFGEPGSSDDQADRSSAPPAEAARLAVERRDLFGPALGVLVIEVVAGGQAEAEGLQVGDVLLTYDGVSIQSVGGLVALLRPEDSGEPVRLTYLRGKRVATTELRRGPLAGVTLRNLSTQVVRSQSRTDGAGPAMSLNEVRSAYRRGNHGEFFEHLLQSLAIGYPEALERRMQELATSRKTRDRGREAALLSAIGEIYRNTGRYAESLEYLGEALAVHREMGDQRGEGNALTNTGLVHDILGRHQEALDHYDRSLAIFRELGDRKSEATAHLNVASVFSSIGRYAEALDHDQQSLALYRDLDDQAGEGLALAGLGNIYRSLGRLSEALEYHQRALAICCQVGNSVGRANLWTNIGNVYWSLGRYSLALDYYHLALSRQREIGDRSGEGNSLANIGAVYQSVGLYPEALEHYQAVLAIRREIGDRSGEGSDLGNIGVVYWGLRRYPEALEYLQQALLVAEDPRDLETQWRAAHGLQLTLGALDRSREAILFGKRAVNAIQALRGHASTLSSELQSSLVGNKSHVFDELAELLIEQGRFGEAQDAMALLKDEEYFDFIRRDAADAGTTEPIRPSAFEAPWAMRYDELSGRLASLGREWAALARIDESVRSEEERTRYAELDAGLDAARGDFRTFLAELEAACAAADSAGRDHTSQIGHDEAAPGILEELERQNENWRAVLVHYLVTEDDVHVLVSTPEVQLARKVTIAEGDLNERIFAYLQTLQNPRADPLPQARALYDLLVAPIAGDLAQAAPRVVMLYLDGALRYLPFAALHSGEHWLIEDYALAIYTARTAQRMVSPAPSWRVAALGASRGGDGFGPLPSVPFELDGIVREETREEDTEGVLPGLVRLDEAFTSDSLSQVVKARGRNHYPVVHVASHFRFAPGGTHEDSYLLLGDGGRLSLAALLSGPFPMSGVDLLALSACQTGVGGEGGTGAEVEGLAYVAQELNAKSVLATLWSVADASTGLFMRELYAARESRQLTKAEALRAAQLALLHGQVDLGALPDELQRGLEVLAPDSGAAPHYIPDPAAPLAHPYYWAPFILMGNWL